jgi:DNA modification methylase
MVIKSEFDFNGLKYQVYYKDCSDMSEVKSNSVQLIITSPPYFNLKDYSELPKPQKGQLPASPIESRKKYKDYLNDLMKIWKECARVVKKDGVIFVNVDVIRIKTKNKNIIPLPFHIIQQIEKLKFGCKDIYVYKKTTGVPFHFGKKLKNRSEYLLVFCRTNNYKFNIDDVRIPYPKNYIYPPGHKRRNPIGATPSTIWEFIPPFQSGGKNHYHYCPFPDGLVDRAIKLFTDEEDIVLDPFLGSGKVVSRAKAIRRIGIGYEINPIFKETIEKMIFETPIEKMQSKDKKNKEFI